MQEYHYFINSNSCIGFHSYFRSNYGGLEDVIHLEDYPAELLQEVIQRVLAVAEEKDAVTEVVHNCLDNTIEGVILPQFRTGLLNVPAYIEYGYPVSQLMEDKAVEETRSRLLQAHKAMAEAKRVHDQWERIYMENTDYGALNSYTERWIQEQMAGHRTEGTGRQVHRFFGAATEDGAVDWIDQLTADIGSRFLLKGRPGTGKSTFLKNIVSAATEAGYDVEVYHCAFDPLSLDMVTVRALDFCVFDSTAPHEYSPEREQDRVLDLYAAGVRGDTDVRCGEALRDLRRRYREWMSRARLEIAAANTVRLEREAMLCRAVRREKVEPMLEDVLQQLFRQETD